MRRLFTIIVSLLVFTSAVAYAQPSNEKSEEQKTEKTENDSKKDDDKDKKKPRKPIQIVVYEFAWSWVTR